MINPADLVAANTDMPLELGGSVDALAGSVVAAVAPPLDIAEPITLERAKEHLRVVGPDEDAYISSLIVTARQMAEGRLNRTIVQRRRTATFHKWGVSSGHRFYLGRSDFMFQPMGLLKPPVISVDNIGYIDATGAETMLDSAAFYMPPAGDDEMPTVEVRVDAALPPLVYGRRDAVRVYYTAGYPVGGVPQPIVQWMLLAIGTMYANRENEIVGATVAPLPDNFSRWPLQPYMVYE